MPARRVNEDGASGESRQQETLPTPAATVSAELEQELTTALAKYVPEPQRKEVGRVVHQVVSATFHQGPLPPPELLEHYDQLIPRGAERIMGMAEREQEHRHSLDRKALAHERSYSMTGMIGGIVLGCACVGGAMFAAWLGQVVIGTALVAVPAMTMIGKLVQGRLRQSENGQVPSQPELPRRGSPKNRPRRR